jgi:hypothetical protein
MACWGLCVQRVERWGGDVSLQFGSQCLCLCNQMKKEAASLQSGCMTEVWWSPRPKLFLCPMGTTMLQLPLQVGIQHLKMNAGWAVIC